MGIGRPPSSILYCLLNKWILAIFVLMTLSVAPILFLYRVKEIIREKIVIYFRLNETLPAIRFMKEQEEKNKFAAMQKAFRDTEMNLSHVSLAEATLNYTKNLNTNELIAREYKQLIVKQLCCHTSFSPLWLKSLTAWSIQTEHIDVRGNIDYEALLRNCPEIKKQTELHSAFKSLLLTSDGKETPYAEKLSTKMQRRCDKLKKIASHLSQHIHEFNQLLGELLLLLKDQQKLYDNNPTQANRNFIWMYRQLLQHPLYIIFKLDPDAPHVSLLHHFACAMWNDVHIMNEYKLVGKAIAIGAGLKDKKNDVGGHFLSLPVLLSASQAYVAKVHHTNDNLISKIRYASTHFWNFMGTLASEGGIARLLPKLLGVEKYDSHGTLSNNPSLQGTTNWQGPFIMGAVNNCYGGTPTIGDDQIAPEFKALLQAIENNVLNPKGRESKRILSQVIYNNLQNVDKFHGEGPRSRTLMKLNETYPLSFKGSILSKDSALYLMKSPKEVVWENSHQFGSILKEKLMLGVYAPENSGHGYYFFGPSDKWIRIFDAIIEAVDSQFSEVESDPSFEEKISLQGAYQEYVYALLISVIECQTIHDLNAAGIENPLVTTLTACKENIDRGGMENMKYMYLRLPFNGNQEAVSSVDQLEYLVGVMNSRPLSVRDRAILKNRMHQTLSFIKKITPEQFNQTLTNLLEGLNLQASMTYTVDTDT